MAESSQEGKTFSRKLVAVLCADAVNYSRLIGFSDEETHIAVSRSIELLRAQISEFGGRLLTITGDGVLADFASAVRAVEAGVAIQRALRRSEVTDMGHGRLEFRVGITLGDVGEDTDKIFGNALNLASRIQNFSPPGELCVTRSVHEEVRQHLPHTSESLGEREIKGFEGSIELFRISPESDGAVKAARVRETRGSLDLPVRPSIAVLRFDCLGGADLADFNLFGDGLSEDITTHLSKYKELFVIARNSAFAFDGRSTNVEDIATSLGVRYVVEGSVRASGNRVRINAQLIDAAERRHIWADVFDRELSDFFEVQDEVTKVIVSTIAGRLTEAERVRARKAAPKELEAYGWLLRGRDAFQQYSQEGNRQAQNCYIQAIELNPDFARAYTALSRTHLFEWQFGWSSDPEASLKQAFDCANRAVSLDPEDPHGYTERGFVYLFRKEVDLAIVELQRAHRMNPNDADIMVELAEAMTYKGQLEEAVQFIQQAMRLNPYYPDFYLWYLADALYCMGRFRDTIAAVLRMHYPNAGRRLLAASYAQLGESEMARIQAEEVLRLQPDFSISAYLSTQPDLKPANLELVAEGLRRAGLPE